MLNPADINRAGFRAVNKHQILRDQIGDAVFVRLSQKRQKRAWRTLIDIEDFERVTQSNWYASPHGRGAYAIATSLQFLPAHHKRLHAFILKAKPGEIIDHISGDTLDNRKQNLRIVTVTDNAKNRRRPTFPGKTSRFKGVCWSKYDARWLAAITSDGVHHYLGLFCDEADAARAYDEAAIRLHKEFARTNATMKLFEVPDPFVADCSPGAFPHVGRRGRKHFEPKHPFNDDNRPYHKDLAYTVERELDAYRETGEWRRILNRTPTR